MALKEELEILRGETIQVFEGEPLNIPCIERSDSEKLCKSPVVSVCMTTYNHEAYIRRAIEGVMMQVTDFEVELIIGEDCSQDRTREICFEYQDKYPDKIRVLWWHENVSEIGGNWRRVAAHCRGEFVAYCEGDDYWTDPYKLTKQVDRLKDNPNVGFCFAKARLMQEGKGKDVLFDSGNKIPAGQIPGDVFFKWHVFGRSVGAPSEDLEFIMTSTVMVRKQVLDQLKARNEVFSWRLRVGDTTIWSGLSTCSDAYYLPEEVSVYRINRGGVTTRSPMPVCRDAQTVHLYWLKKQQWEKTGPMSFVYGRLFAARVRYCLTKSREDRVKEARQIMLLKEFRYVSGFYRSLVLMCASSMVPSWLLFRTVNFVSMMRRRFCSASSR